MPEPLTTAELYAIALDVFHVGVMFAIAWVCLAGMCVGSLAIVRGYMGIGRG